MRIALRTVGIVVVLLSSGLVAAMPAAAGGGGCHRDAVTGPVEGDGTQVDLAQYCMSPTVLRAAPGATVTFTNRDEAMHNLFGSGMFVGELAPNQSVAFRFDDAGTYAYACTLHPGMVGAIAVGDGRRAAPLDRLIAPVEVQATATTTTTALAAVPTAATTDDEAVPVVPTAAVLGAVALAGYLAGRRRRRGGTGLVA